MKPTAISFQWGVSSTYVRTGELRFLSWQFIPAVITRKRILFSLWLSAPLLAHLHSLFIANLGSQTRCFGLDTLYVNVINLLMWFMSWGHFLTVAGYIFCAVLSITNQPHQLHPHAENKKGNPPTQARTQGRTNAQQYSKHTKPFGNKEPSCSHNLHHFSHSRINSFQSWSSWLGPRGDWRKSS